MTDDRDAGRPVVAITRAREDALSLAVALDAHGLRPLVAPLIRIVPRPAEGLAQVLGQWEQYDWIACTSRHAVDALAEGCRVAGIAPHLLGMLRVAAVGGATASALASLGIPVSVVPERGDAEQLAAALLATAPGAGARVLFPRAAAARDSLPAALRAAGLLVDDVIAYETLPCEAGAAELASALSRQEVAVVTLASGSAARAFGALVPADLHSRTRLVSIGATTSEIARSMGLRVVDEAESPNVEALARAARRAVTETHLNA
ncbi:MAG: uroporphyrinogen-III synthase [Gemmatimonadaceae bacterium]